MLVGPTLVHRGWKLNLGGRRPHIMFLCFPLTGSNGCRVDMAMNFKDLTFGDAPWLRQAGNVDALVKRNMSAWEMPYDAAGLTSPSMWPVSSWGENNSVHRKTRFGEVVTQW